MAKKACGEKWSRQEVVRVQERKKKTEHAISKVFISQSVGSSGAFMMH